MSIPCPKCGFGFSRWQFLWFTRLFSFGCANCRAQIAISGRGRAALWVPILSSIPLAIFVGILSGWDFAVPVILIVGLVAGPVLASRVGTFGIYVGESDSETG